MSFPKYPKYKQSNLQWTRELPEHWESWKLAHAFSVIGSGTTPKTDNRAYYDDGEIPWINTGDLNDGELVACDKRITQQAIADHTSLRLYPTGSLLIAMYGATIGKLGVLRFPATVNQACCVFGGTSPILARFMFYWFIGLRQQILSLATGGGQPNVSQDILRTLRVSCPSSEEQTEIIRFLDRETSKIDSLVAEQRRLIELLKEKRQAVISHAVTKGLNPHAPMKPSGIEWLADVPEHWQLRRVKTVSSFVTSGPRGWSERIGETGSLFVQSGDLNDHMEVEFMTAKRVQVENDAESTRTRMREGDVVVCVTGAKTGNVAVCNIIPEPAYVNQHLCLIRPTPDVLSSFLGVLLKSRLGQIYFEISQYGLKQGLSLEDVEEAPVILPPVNEQQEIIALLDTETAKLDALTSEAERAIELLQERRTALISAAVTGKIDVRNLVEAN